MASDNLTSPPPVRNPERDKALARLRAKRLRAERLKALSGRAEVKPATVSVREFILMTGLSHATIYRGIADGSIASTKKNGRRLIAFAEVERLRGGE
jgi:predicted DNA-binding transcriptional regulator AlpA